ncbi:diphosphomevalonate/mevalonate 3,5-bisphosphate decarboxylase family protein [Croceimicrobium sp.]|uniref:diphosphomevalonate/mevalonate 3,5-bisphosphate decarboxylase family protein n=1 Tax=Croceimicrobium sp. TaxID=2828340 RepID=UPI003BA88526
MNSKSSSWRSPSNIALVKYWGKYEPQLPANPSLSFTLKESYTETKLEILEEGSQADFDFEVYLDYRKADNFKPKIEQFFKRIEEELDFLKGHKFSIHTYNSFPHSSGIASSASGMSALALCLLSLSPEGQKLSESEFYRKASEWARLGSGSASRSLFGGLGLWGKTEGIAESSDEYAIPYTGKVDSIFQEFRDTILLVEKGQKAVSSTAGHGLMKGHPFAQERFAQAHRNMASLQSILAKGDLEAFGELVESEALTLHAMMMSSRPYFLLMKPNTLQIIEEIWNFRRETLKPLYFTLDAGANVHLLYPKSIEQEALDFVNSTIKGYLKNGEYICDQVGPGPTKLT